MRRSRLPKKELAEVKIEDEVSDVICDQCGRNMVIKYGLTESFWHVRASRNVGIQRRILRKPRDVSEVRRRYCD